MEKLQKTQEMLDRVDGENFWKKYMEDMFYYMREFKEQFLDDEFDLDMLEDQDWWGILTTVYCTLPNGDGCSVVINRATRYWFDGTNNEEFVDYMVDLYNRAVEMKTLFSNFVVKWENSTK